MVYIVSVFKTNIFTFHHKHIKCDNCNARIKMQYVIKSEWVTIKIKHLEKAFIRSWYWTWGINDKIS